MNKFRNAYVDPDSFDRNSTNLNHFSIVNQGKSKKEVSHSQKTNWHINTKKHGIYINDHLEKISESKPVIFSPPMVDSIQKPLNESRAEESTFNNAQNKKTDKEEVVADLIKEFSLMLEDTTSIYEGITDLPEREIENDSLLNFDESKTIHYNASGNEESTIIDDKNLAENNGSTAELLSDEFYSMLDESVDYSLNGGNNRESLSENNDILEDKFFTQLSNNSELQEEMQAVSEEDGETHNGIINNDLLTMFLESSSYQEEKQDDNMNAEASAAKSGNTGTLEVKFLEMLAETDELQEEKQNSTGIEAANDVKSKNNDTSKVKYSEMLTESDEMQDEKQDTSSEYLKESKSAEIEEFPKDEHPLCYESLIEKKKTTTVKIPVLLTRFSTDVDIIESINLIMPLDNISKVEWSVQSLDCKVVLPSKTVFLKGEFTAEIAFSNKEFENEIQSLKIIIPWTKTEDIHWLAIPDIPYRSQKEFLFQSQPEHDSDYHYDEYQKFVEPIQSQLKQVHFIWHQEQNLTEKQLQVNGVAQLSIHIMQDQLIELDGYSK